MSTKLLSETICRKGLMVKCFVALIVFCCSVGEAFAQTNTKVTINVNNVLIRTALDQLQREAKIHFVYDEENIDSGKRVSLSYTETPLNAVLDDFCKQTSLRYEVKRNLILILPSKAEKTTGKHEPFYMTGVVTDETGESIIGATIMIGGTSQGTVTDIDGRYSLQVTPGDLVSFTFVGMADKVVKVQAGKKVVNVKMETNATALADVVVTGYQTLSKERATGSYSVISEKSTKGKLETDVLSRIEGLVAGINKTSSNSNDVVIRGITTYMGNTKPLYVVDGMPYEGDLASINPTDVQNITVLKDAAASSGLPGLGLSLRPPHRFRLGCGGGIRLPDRRHSSHGGAVHRVSLQVPRGGSRCRGRRYLRQRVRPDGAAVRHDGHPHPQEFGGFAGQTRTPHRRHQQGRHAGLRPASVSRQEKLHETSYHPRSRHHRKPRPRV